MVVAGLSIGVVVGIIGGVIALVLVRTLDTAVMSDARSIVTLVGQLLTLPAFLLGASFLATSAFFSANDLVEIRPLYFSALAITFSVIMVYPIYRWIHKLGRELGEGA